MCLTLLEKFPTREKARAVRPKVARTDMIVYRRFEKWEDASYLVSPHRGAIYELGKEYRSRLGRTCFQEWGWTNCGRWCVDINQGRHAWRTLKDAGYSIGSGCCSYTDVILRCVIPKGSEYFDGNDGDIVSTCIRLPKVLRDYTHKARGAAY